MFTEKPIIYQGRLLNNKKISLDVRNFVNENDYLLKDIIKNNNLIKDTEDQTAFSCQEFVKKALKYKTDKTEFWQFTFETIELGYGDCEDGAILLCSLLLNCGISQDKVKICVGYVQPKPTAPKGGHAYCKYKNEKGKWIILDWCYTGDYKEIWFEFNNEKSWANEEMIIEGRVKK